MLAKELAGGFPSVRPDARLGDVLAVVVRDDLPGVVLLDRHGRPQATPSLRDILDLLVPWPLRESPGLARVIPEGMAERMLAETLRRPVDELVEGRTAPSCRVRGQATVLEVATMMACRHSALATVLEGRPGSDVISAHGLFAHLLRAGDHRSTECRDANSA